MTTLEAVVLGAVQGLTEFLPISSTAHLRIVPALLGWADPGAAYSAVIQCGTLAAICLAMRRDIAAVLGGFLDGLRRGRPLETVESRLALMIATGTLPIVAVGLAIRPLLHGDARRLDVVTTSRIGYGCGRGSVMWQAFTAATIGVGSIGAPPRGCTSKCRCGVVVLPVAPFVPRI